MSAFAVVLAAFALCLLIGLVLSVRAEVRKARAAGRSVSLAVVAGAVLALPFELVVLTVVGLAALAAALATAL